MLCLNEEDYIDSYDYFLIDEAFNARQMFFEIMDLVPEKYMMEENLISINEGAIESIKNFIATVAKRIAAAIEKFIFRIEQLIGIDKKWLEDNQDTITKGVIIPGSEFNNFHDYTNLDQIVNTKILDECTEATLEANKTRWEDEDGYISTNPSLGIVGFHYNSENANSLQDQIQSFLRGEKRDNVKSEELTQDKRVKYFQFCLQTFPAAKTTINEEKNTLKNVTDTLERYIDTKRSQQKTQPQPSDISNTQTAQPVQATVNPSTPANVSAVPSAFEFKTSGEFLTEVEITQTDKPKNTNSTTGEKVDQKVDVNKDVENKNKDDIAQISKAARTYFKVNTKKLSAKMNICMEAYKTRIKLLKWFVGAVKEKNKSNNKETTAQQKVSVNTTPANTNKKLSDNFD